MPQFDYIVVGAGSAGCVLADKLSENGRHRVLVIEAGGSDRRFWIKVPIGYARTFHDEKLNWMYETRTSPELNNRSSYWPRGKVIGGSSSINAMCYVRGLPEDFNDWRDQGNVGWEWQQVLPQYNSFERFVNVPGTAENDNPLFISNVYEAMHPLKTCFRSAASELGQPYNENMNGDNPEGFAAYQINTNNSIRCSAADAFLKPALKRKNVQLESHAQVTRVLFENGTAIGVEYRQGGQLKQARATREVILSGGAVNTPLLLQHSGVGPAGLLNKHGIKLVRDIPAVGKNLQDHLAVSYRYIANVPTLNDELHSWSGKLLAGVKYILFRKGPLALSVNQNGGFVRSSPDRDRADLQLYFNPVSYSTTEVANRRPLTNPDPFSGFILSFQPCRPTSRGHLQISSPDPMSRPEIFPNYLSTEEDIREVIAGGRYIRQLAQTQAMKDVIAQTLTPNLEEMSDEEILADFRLRADTVFHPVGTCKMGVDTNSCVVDPSLKVHGLDRLRVIDASIFPTLTSGNTHAPTVMVAHKGADMVLAEAQ
jgi:choline dehydrogenase